jgi:hypothetical protein
VRGPKQEYLAMLLDFSSPGVLKVEMNNYVPLGKAILWTVFFSTIIRNQKGLISRESNIMEYHLCQDGNLCSWVS